MLERSTTCRWTRTTAWAAGARKGCSPVRGGAAGCNRAPCRVRCSLLLRCSFCCCCLRVLYALRCWNCAGPRRRADTPWVHTTARSPLHTLAQLSMSQVSKLLRMSASTSDGSSSSGERCVRGPSLLQEGPSSALRARRARCAVSAIRWPSRTAKRALNSAHEQG